NPHVVTNKHDFISGNTVTGGAQLQIPHHDSLSARKPGLFGLLCSGIGAQRNSDVLQERGSLKSFG
ncbi:MAG: hypothetical protein VX751_01830, partial [Pseudomonadota bacterium]|nr:hypothetical protein [Pseudomonadota bacterium]